MGNHEFCSGCGASDFHSGMSCQEAYPERWAEKEKERKAKQAIIDKEAARVAKLINLTLKKGRKAIVARLLAIRKEEEKLIAKREALKAKIKKLSNEDYALREHCPHPSKYVESGFMYTSCSLCSESDV